MDTDDRRVHLIERAAARLDRAAGLGGPAIAAARPETLQQPDEATLRQVEQLRSAAKPRGPRIERAALERAGAIDWEGADSRVAEEFRVACAEILRRSTGPGRGSVLRPNLVMISSALPGEGKSFAAINLAVGIALHGNYRVLLVDADEKPGSLTDLLGAQGEPGLLDLAAGCPLGASDLVIQSALPNLDFLPVGGVAVNRAEILGNVAAAIDDLARSDIDRLVLIDSPPSLSSSRPHLLAPVVGQAVVVVAASSTQQSDLEAALALLEGCPGVSLLLNKVSRWHAHSFGSYGYSG